MIKYSNPEIETIQLQTIVHILAGSGGNPDPGFRPDEETGDNDAHTAIFDPSLD